MRAAAVLAVVAVVVLLALGASAQPQSAVAERMRQYDESVAREVVSAFVFGFLQEEIAVNRTTAWIQLLTMEPPLDQALILQAAAITRFRKHVTRNMQAPICLAYGEAMVETLQMAPARYTRPPQYAGGLRRAEIVARAAQHCHELTVSTGASLSPMQMEALRSAHVMSLLVTSTLTAANLPHDD
jgi:hypothetical protein